MSGATAFIAPECLGCGACLLTCPERAIRPAPPDGRLIVLPRCTGCGECAEVCPADAIDIRPASPAGAQPAVAGPRPGAGAAGLPSGRATTTEAT